MVSHLTCFSFFYNAQGISRGCQLGEKKHERKGATPLAKCFHFSGCFNLTPFAQHIAIFQHGNRRNGQLRYRGWNLPQLSSFWNTPLLFKVRESECKSLLKENSQWTSGCSLVMKMVFKDSFFSMEAKYFTNINIP